MVLCMGGVEVWALHTMVLKSVHLHYDVKAVFLHMGVGTYFRQTQNDLSSNIMFSHCVRNMSSRSEAFGCHGIEV